MSSSRISLACAAAPRARSIVSAGLLAMSTAAPAPAGGLTENVGVVAEWDARSGYTDVTAHSTGGVDLAIVATETGVAFVNVTDPSAPVEVGFVSGAAGAHAAAARGNVAYVVSSGGGGLTVVSLASPTNPTVHTTLDTFFDSAGALAVDLDTAVLYVAASDAGFLGLDISTPLAPSASFDPLTEFPVTTLTARRPYGYASSGNAFVVLNVNAPPSVGLLAWLAYPETAPAATALSGDFRRVMVADARPSGGNVRIYDVTAPLRIVRVSETEHALVGDARAVDVSWPGTLAYVAWGEAGLEILDTTDEKAPRRAGAYASSAPDAGGIVGVDAETASGLAYVLDANAGLALLAHETPLGEVAGLVTDSFTQGPAAGITVRAEGPTTRSTSLATDGTYRLALPPGAYDVHYEGFLHEPRVEAVLITAGEEATTDVTLNRRPVGTIRGTVNLETRDPSMGGARAARHPEGTIIRVLDTPRSFTAGFGGFYILPTMPVGEYVVEADRFGYDPQQFPVTVSEGAETFQDFQLSFVHYADDLSTEGGWTVGGPEDTATSGIWERVIPVGTGAGYIQPATDETPDPDSTAFVTGNAAPSAWFDVADVDGGRTTVRSPVMDLTTLEEPVFRYYRWFSNDATWLGESFDADTFALDVSVDGGGSWTNLETLTRSELFWAERDFVLSRYVDVSASTQFRVRVADTGMPSIVEAAFDDVEVWDAGGLLELPPVPIDLASVSIVSAAPGRVTLRWIADGAYDSFDVERADGVAPRVVGRVPGGAPGGRYAFTDRSAPGGRAVRYWIVGHRGVRTEREGPFIIWVQRGGAISRVLAPAPNPASGRATLRFEVADERGDGGAVEARLRLFDAGGRWLVTLARGAYAPGVHSVAWDGRDARGRTLPSGVYWYELATPGGRASGRLVRTR